MSNDKAPPSLPILNGISVGERGEYNGVAVIIRKPEDLKKVTPECIPILSIDVKEFFQNNLGEFDRLANTVYAILAEFGYPVDDFAAIIYAHEIIGLMSIDKITEVVQDGMKIRIFADEGTGTVEFIE